MAVSSNPESLAIEVQVLKDTLALLLSNSKQPKDGTSTAVTTDDTLFPIQNTGEEVKFIRKADFLEVVFGGIRQIKDSGSEVTEVGQIAIGSKTGINGGQPFIGFVTFYPPTTDAHINFIYQSL